MKFPSSSSVASPHRLAAKAKLNNSPIRYRFRFSENMIELPHRSFTITLAIAVHSRECIDACTLNISRDKSNVKS